MGRVRVDGKECLGQTVAFANRWTYKRPPCLAGGFHFALTHEPPRVKPVLQALVLADNVYQDKDTGKFIIAGTFTELRVHSPTTDSSQDEGQSPREPQEQSIGSHIIAPRMSAGSPHAYISMTDFAGEAMFALRFVDLATYEIKMQANLKLRSENKLHTIEVHIPLPVLPRVLGEYALEFLYEDEPLGSWRVSVRYLDR